MNLNKIARDNHAFFYVAVGMALCSEGFKQAVLLSFDAPVLYGIANKSYPGYINIDCLNIKENCSQGEFCSEVCEGIFSKIAMKLADSVKGELNTEVEMVQGIYRFLFKITKYERNSENDFETINNLEHVPDEEMLGRFIELKIIIA